MATRKLGALLFPVAILLQLCLCQITPEILPEFLAPLENHTVIQGREVTFTCIVNHLNSYRVAWIKSDSRAILAIHTHLVTHNNRLSVTHNGHNTWKLTVSNVQKNDSGTYMCQVNTDPMLSQIGSITVVVPPDIIDEASSESPMAHEGGNINLRCVATGTPEPNVTWKREDGKNIILRENGLRKSVPKYDNETLELSGVLRTEMGAYLCIASNGIPPSISKRYSVLVQFSPSIKVTNNVVAAPVNKHVALQCIVEASPQAMNTWHTNGEKLLPSEKYVMTEKQINEYTWAMNLTIRMLKKTDFRSYMCSSDNALGKAEGSVSLQELELFPTTTPGTQSRPNDLRPGKKKPNNKSDNRSRNKNEQHHRNNENSENFYSHNNQDNDLSHGGSSNSLSGHTTQTMNGGGQARGQHHTERPHFYPSVSPDWTSVNEANQRFSKQVWVIMTIGLYAIFARRYCV